MSTNYSERINNANKVVYSFTHPCGITMITCQDTRIMMTIKSDIASLDIMFDTIDKCSKINNKIVTLLNSSDFDDVVLGLYVLANYIRPFNKHKYQYLKDTINLYYDWCVKQIEQDDEFNWSQFD